MSLADARELQFEGSAKHAAWPSLSPASLRIFGNRGGYHPTLSPASTSPELRRSPPSGSWQGLWKVSSASQRTTV